MTTELTITTERIDDFPLLLATMQRLGLPAILDRHLPRHGLQQGLSWGWLATIWLAHILSQGDHRKLPVQAWVRQAGDTLRRITGLPGLTELDFTDDRLTLVLSRLSHPPAWAAIETELGCNILLIVISNQGAVGRGLTTCAAVEEIHARMVDAIRATGGRVDDVLYCPHRPEDGCPCRKPRPGMLLRAAERWQIDLAASILVGDAEADILAAHNAGCRSLLVLTGRGAEQLAFMSAAGRDGCAVADDLRAAADQIIALRLTQGP